MSETPGMREEFQEALKAQRDLLLSVGAGQYDKVLLRIEEVEKAHATFKGDLERVPTQLDRESSRLQILFDEKLRSTNIRIDREHDVTQTIRSTMDRVIEAAFESAERLAATRLRAFEQQITKSEASFTKEIDAQKALLSSAREGLASGIANLTARLDRGEGGWHGVRREIGDRQQSTTTIMTIIGQIVAFGVLLSMIFGLWISSHSNQTVRDDKRMDDLMAQMSEQNHEMANRLDALSARMNALTGRQPTPPTVP